MSDYPLVIVTQQLPEAWLVKLNGRCRPIIGPETIDGFAPQLRPHLAEAEGILTMLTVPVDAAFLDAAPNLRVVSNMAVGVDNIDLAACAERGIPVGHTPGVLVEGTADLTMALLLAAARRLPEASGDARDGRWTTWIPTAWLGKDLSGATLGIVGMGKIGQAAAARAKAFGMNIVYHSRSPKPEAEATLGAARLSLADLLQQSDFVSLHTPLTPETHHLIDEAALRLMKRDAILVNIARGPVVDTNALVHALQEGWIQFAALDVTDPEPLPADHILYRLPNCFIVPHIGSATVNTRCRMAELACENLLAGLNGRRLLHCANPQVYERKS
jgi:lactate dehydrogenase-like 2-hydroxyacid dehydrogenase